MQQALPFRNRLAYGLGDVYGGGSFFIIGTFMMFFLVKVAGLAPAHAGLVVGIGKAWDAILDPLMGHISDRTVSRFGRRRIYFLLAIVPIVVSFVLLWAPCPFTGELPRFLHYTGVFLLFYTVYTMAMVPYTALAADMTTDFQQRNSLSGMRIFCSQAATLIAALSVQPLIDRFADQATGHLMMGTVFGVLFALPWLFVFLGTWELPYEHAKPQKTHVFRNLLGIFSNRSFRIHLAMYICAYTAIDFLMAGLKFYVIDILNRPTLVPQMLGSLLVSQLVTLPLYIMAANRRGISPAFITGMLIGAVALVALALLPHDAPAPAFLLCCMVAGAGLSGAVSIPWITLPFIVDIDELLTGQKRAGLYAGAMSLTRKLIQGAVVLPAFGFLLQSFGYGGQRTAGSPIAGLEFVVLGMPVAVLLAGVAFASAFRVTRERHARVLAENERLHGGGRIEEASPEARELFESLTGNPFEKWAEHRAGKV